eukprot:XP_001706151.1 Hypothetical protein GL50803_86994 [Giardia lamblia ATCC 50803]
MELCLLGTKKRHKADSNAVIANSCRSTVQKLILVDECIRERRVDAGEQGRAEVACESPRIVKEEEGKNVLAFLVRDPA